MVLFWEWLLGGLHLQALLLWRWRAVLKRLQRIHLGRLVVALNAFWDWWHVCAFDLAVFGSATIEQVHDRLLEPTGLLLVSLTQHQGLLLILNLLE